MADQRIDRHCTQCGCEKPHNIHTLSQGQTVFRCLSCGRAIRLIPRDPDKAGIPSEAELDEMMLEFNPQWREKTTPMETEAGSVRLGIFGLVEESARGQDKLNFLVRQHALKTGPQESRQLRLALPPAIWEGLMGLAARFNILPGKLAALALHQLAFIIHVRSAQMQPQLLAYIRTSKKRDSADRITKRVRINLPSAAWQVLEHLARAGGQPLETVTSRLVSAGLLLGETMEFKAYYARKRAGQKSPAENDDENWLFDGDWLEPNPERGFLDQENLFSEEGEVDGWILEEGELEN